MESNTQQNFNTSLDNLLVRKGVCKDVSKYFEFLDFMTKFKDTNLYNNMLVYLQNPNCDFYATENYYKESLNNDLKPNAVPIFIYDSKHPIKVVYDISHTICESPISKPTKPNLKPVTNLKKIEYYKNGISHLKREGVSFNEKMDDKSFLMSRSTDFDGGTELIINAEYDIDNKLYALILELAALYLGFWSGSHIYNKRFDKEPKSGLESVEVSTVYYIIQKKLNLSTSPVIDYKDEMISNKNKLHLVSMELLVKATNKKENILLTRA